MNKIITQKMKYKQSVIKYSYKHGVKKAAIQFNEWPKTIYRWRERYDGSIESLKDKSRRPHSHPNQHTEQEIKMIRNYKRNNKETGLVVLWVKLKEAGYTRTIQGLYHVLQKLGIYEKAPSKAKEKKKGEKIPVTYPGEKVQIDVKYAFFGEIRYYQLTAVDIATKISFRYLYSEKTPESTINFLERMLEYFPFRVHCIQTDNGTEFTYRKLLFEKEHPLDIFCKKKHIKRVYSPVSSPWYNCVVESTHHCDQQEFCDFCTQELTLEKANQKLRKYNNFWNYKRIHSTLNYDTPMLYFKKLRNT